MALKSFKIPLSLRVGTLDRVERMVRAQATCDFEVNVPSITFVLLITSNPRVFGVMIKHHYALYKELVQSLGMTTIARTIEAPTPNARQSMRVIT